MEKKLKIILLTVLSLAIVFAFACGKDEKKNEEKDPTAIVTDAPTDAAPTDVPTEEPTKAPTQEPTEKPTKVPDVEPTQVPEGLPAADIFSASITSSGLTDVSAHAYEVTSVNEPDTVYDAEIGRYVMPCDGDDDKYDYQVFGYSENYAELEKSGFSVEVYAKYGYNDHEMFAVSNLHAGGFAIGVDEPDEDICVLFENGGSYEKIFFGTTESDKYYHYVLTFDGAALTLYLNGEKTEEAQISNYYFTKNAGASYLCIGADSSEARDNEYFWDGAIAKANIYSGALTADQVKLLYENR